MALALIEILEFREVIWSIPWRPEIVPLHPANSLSGVHEG